VECVTLNVDAELDWLMPYREQYGLHLPIMHHATGAFDQFHLGRAYRNAPPLYVVIDKGGIVRHRSWRQGSISLEDVAELVDSLVRE